MIDYADVIGDTRGSALYYDEKGSLREGLEEMFRFTEEQGSSRERVQEVVLTAEGFAYEACWRPVRPLPTEPEFFENVWRSYREHKNIY